MSDSIQIRDTFNHIYTNKIWGSSNTNTVFSGHGSSLPHASLYCQYISNFIRDHPEIRKVIDYGCGDWQVGSNINYHQATVQAFDISDVVLAANRARYPDIEFNTIDQMSRTDPVDLILIRQVLQHLSFADIHQILQSLPPSKYYLFTDHQPDILTYKNFDKSTDNYIRNGGLYLECEPFNFQVITRLTYRYGGETYRTIQYIPDQSTPTTVEIRD